MLDRPRVIDGNSSVMTGGHANVTEDYAPVTEVIEAASYRYPRVPVRWYTAPNLTDNSVLSFADDIRDEMSSHLTTPMSSNDDLSPEVARPFNLTEFEYAMRSAMPGYERNHSALIPPNDDKSLINMLSTQEGAILIAINILLGE